MASGRSCTELEFDVTDEDTKLSLQLEGVPENILKTYYDVLLVGSSKDGECLQQFQHILQSCITLAQKCTPLISILLYDYEAESSSIFSQLESALSTTNFVFVYLTKNTSEDHQVLRQIDECVTNYLHQNEAPDVIPIDAGGQRRCGLWSINGYSLKKLFTGYSVHCLSNIPKEKLTFENIKKYDLPLLNTLRKKIGSRLVKRIEFNKKQCSEIQLFLKEKSKTQIETEQHTSVEVPSVTNYYQIQNLQIGDNNVMNITSDSPHVDELCFPEEHVERELCGNSSTFSSSTLLETTDLDRLEKVVDSCSFTDQSEFSVEGSTEKCYPSLDAVIAASKKEF